MPVTALHIEKVGPLEKIDFKFDPQVNVFVGPNNTGKTTALLVLADIICDPLGIPSKLLRYGSGAMIEINGDGGAVRRFSGSLPVQQTQDGSADGFINARAGLGYRAYIPALRISTNFRSSGPEAKKSTPAVRSAYETGEQGDPGAGTLWIDDRTVIQAIVDLDYRSYRENKTSIRQLINQIAELASVITEGFPIQFAGIGEDQGYYPVFKTPDGQFPLNVLSQGTQSLIQLCAKLLIGYAEHYDFPNSLVEKPGVLIVDEIDAHLHPSWQRRVLPAITKHLPALQIFCATHSPMTLAGLKAGQIQLLKRNSKGEVCVSTNQVDILGWSADEIYSSFLGVEPTDLATTEKLERLRELRDKPSLSAKDKVELQSLREEMHHRLVGGSVTEQAEELAAALKEATAESASKTVHGNGKPTKAKRTRR